MCMHLLRTVRAHSSRFHLHNPPARLGLNLPLAGQKSLLDLSSSSLKGGFFSGSATNQGLVSFAAFDSARPVGSSHR